MSSSKRNGKIGQPSKRICLYLISSLQIADQYMPAPGSPYRPVLSPPAQLYNLQSGWPNCVITHAFAGIDPPRALMPAAALVPHQTPASPQSQVTTADPEKVASRSPEASVTGATRDPSPAPAHRSNAAGPTSTPSPSAPSTAIKDPHTSKTSLDPQKAQHAKIHSQLNGWQARVSSEAASEKRVSSEKAKDLNIHAHFKDGSFISPPKPETSGEPLNAFQPSKVSSDQNSDQKATLSPNPATPDPLPIPGEHDEEGATRPLTRTAQNPSPEDDPARAGASFISDSTKANTNGPPTPIINNSPTDPAAVATGGDPDPGSRPTSSSPSTHHEDPSPNDPGNPYPQPQTSPLPSNADGESAPTPPSTSNPLLQPPALEAPPSSVPLNSNPSTPQSDPSESKMVDPGLLGQGPFSLIDYHSQIQSSATALGHGQTAAATQAKAAFQPPTNNTNINTNTDSNTNISSTASGSRGGEAQPSSPSPSRSGENSDGNANSVLPFQNGAERKGIDVLLWIVGLGGCVVAMFPFHFI